MLPRIPKPPYSVPNNMVAVGSKWYIRSRGKLKPVGRRRRRRRPYTAPQMSDGAPILALCWQLEEFETYLSDTMREALHTPETQKSARGHIHHLMLDFFGLMQTHGRRFSKEKVIKHVSRLYPRYAVLLLCPGLLPIARQYTGPLPDDIAEQLERIDSPLILVPWIRKLEVVLLQRMGFGNPAKKVTSRPHPWSLHAASLAVALAQAFAESPFRRNYLVPRLRSVDFEVERGMRVSVWLTQGEWDAIATPDPSAYTELVKMLDVDGAWCVFYLIDRMNSTLQDTGSVTINLSELARAIGWTVRSKMQRQKAIRRVYGYIRVLSRASVIGIPVENEAFAASTNHHPGVHAPIFCRLLPIDRNMLWDTEMAPKSVTLDIGEDWGNLLTALHSGTATTIAERVCRIKGGKPRGSWARSIALALIVRRSLQENGIVDKNSLPTRRELLLMFPPSLAPPYRSLDVNMPSSGRAIDHWNDAIRDLVNEGILADVGEAKAVKLARYPSRREYRWQADWLDGPVLLVLKDSRSR